MANLSRSTGVIYGEDVKKVALPNRDRAMIEHKD
jgi:hypothetical protein